MQMRVSHRLCENTAKPYLVWAAGSNPAGAVVMMRFDFGFIGADVQSVAAYGTTVKYK
jgi:uncharacterized protein YbjQ (UPF0145 family)